MTRWYILLTIIQSSNPTLLTVFNRLSYQIRRYTPRWRMQCSLYSMFSSIPYFPFLFPQQPFHLLFFPKQLTSGTHLSLSYDCHITWRGCTFTFYPFSITRSLSVVLFLSLICPIPIIINPSLSPLLLYLLSLKDSARSRCQLLHIHHVVDVCNDPLNFN